MLTEIIIYEIKMKMFKKSNYLPRFSDFCLVFRAPFSSTGHLKQVIKFAVIAVAS